MDREQNSSFTITILGARGSIPVSGQQFSEFGGSTSSYLVNAGEQTIVLDAGLGITEIDNLPDGPVSVLLSHPHLDHLIGLPFFPALYEKDRRIDFYASPREGMSAKELLDGLFSPPYWPCGMNDFPAEFICHDLAGRFQIGCVDIETKEVRHPGGCTAFRLTFDGKVLVYLSDYEQGKDIDRGVKDFVRGADLLLCDAQYTEAEFAGREGFGHSTRARAMRLKEEAGVKKLLLIHHDPRHDDTFLRDAEAKANSPDVRYARQKEVIRL